LPQNEVAEGWIRVRDTKAPLAFVGNEKFLHFNEYIEHNWMQDPLAWNVFDLGKMVTH
jgi:hypothetical protein